MIEHVAGEAKPEQPMSKAWRGIELPHWMELAGTEAFVLLEKQGGELDELGDGDLFGADGFGEADGEEALGGLFAGAGESG